VPRGAAAGALAAVCLALGGALNAPARGDAAVRPEQDLAELSSSHAVMRSPHGRRLTGRSPLPAWRPITGSPTVVPVVGHRTTADGSRWLQVLLPGRPNGGKGWIRRRGTRALSTEWHLVVSTGDRRVRAYRRGRLMRSLAAIVGKPSTPTPRGRFFVEESVRMPADRPGAPFALALSARSNVLQEFEGGPGQIAIHGVGNLGGVPGTAVSHGCVRLADPGIRWLAGHIAAGVPVTIES
jgi:hypothetical protein